MNVQPKWRAAVDIEVGNERYKTGDPVPVDSPHLARLIAFGGFVEEIKPPPHIK